MDNRTPKYDDYATHIGDNLIMMKMKKELTILPDGHIQLPILWKEARTILMDTQKTDCSRYWGRKV
jgi:hypothetical protein